MAKTMIALSHSRLSDFNQCPLKFKLKYLDKAPEFKVDMDKSPHLVRGTNIHEALENYIIKRNAGEVNIRPSSLPEVNSTIPFIDRLYHNYSEINPEAQVAVDCTWQHVEWFDRAAYYRVIFDLFCRRPGELMIVDWKTGKYRDYTPDNGMGQLELSSLIGMTLFPDTETVSSVYVYVDHKKTVPKTYTRADLPKMKDHFVAEHEKVNAETNWDPKLNKFCQWCEATKDLCQYSRKMSFPARS